MDLSIMRARMPQSVPQESTHDQPRRVRAETQDPDRPVERPSLALGGEGEEGPGRDEGGVRAPARAVSRQEPGRAGRAAPPARRVYRRLRRDDARHRRGGEEHAGSVRPRTQELRQEMMLVGRGFAFEDLKPGLRFRTHRRTIAEADAAAFINLTWLTEELFAVVETEASSSWRAIKGRPGPAALVD